MRLCWFPLINERSGDLEGIGFVVYELVGRLSRAFSSSALAARIIAADVLGRVVSVGEPGFMGSGGGARSGSALSHLCAGQLRAAMSRRSKHTWECSGPWKRRTSRGGGQAPGLASVRAPLWTLRVDSTKCNGVYWNVWRSNGRAQGQRLHRRTVQGRCDERSSGSAVQRWGIKWGREFVSVEDVLFVARPPGCSSRYVLPHPCTVVCKHGGYGQETSRHSLPRARLPAQHN